MRAIVLALAAASCQRALAQAPTPTPTPLDRVVAVPTGWTPITPSVAATAAVETAAWAEPSRGCYLVAVRADSPRQNLEDALAGLGRSLVPQARLESWVVANGDGQGRLTRGALSGDLRVSARALGAGARVIAIACVHNQREPAACAARCQTVLASFDPAKAMP